MVIFTLENKQILEQTAEASQMFYYKMDHTAILSIDMF